MLKRRQILALGGGALAVAAIPPIAHYFGGAAREHGLCFGGDKQDTEDLALLPRLGFGDVMQDFIAFCQGRYDTLFFLDTSHSRGLTRLSLFAKSSMQALMRHGYESLHVENDFDDTAMKNMREGKISRATFLRTYKSGEWLDRRLAYAGANALATILEDKSLPLIVPVDARHNVDAPERDFSNISPALLAKLDAALKHFNESLSRDGFINNMNVSCQGNWHHMEIHAEDAARAFLESTKDEPAETIASLYGVFKLKIYDAVYGSDKETAKMIVKNSPAGLKADAATIKGVAVFYGAGHTAETSQLIDNEPNLLEHLEQMGRTTLSIALYATEKDRDDDYQGKAFIEAVLREDTLTSAKLEELARQSKADALDTNLYPVEFILHPDKQEVRINDAGIRSAFDTWLALNRRQPHTPRVRDNAPAPDGRAPR